MPSDTILFTKSKPASFPSCCLPLPIPLPIYLSIYLPIYRSIPPSLSPPPTTHTLLPAVLAPWVQREVGWEQGEDSRQGGSSKGRAAQEGREKEDEPL